MANKAFVVKHGLNPITDNSVDLGTSSLEFKDLYIDGTAFLDAIGFGSVAMTLPTDHGTNGQVLKTNGSNALAWADDTAGTITALNNQTADRLVTIGSTTTQLDGEANLTFDGNDLVINGTNSALLMGVTATDTDESTYNVIQIGAQSSLICKDSTSAGTDAYFGHNVHLTSGGWKHTITDEAEYIGMYNGQIAFNTAPSASADAAFNGATRLLIGSDGAITHTVSATTAYNPDATRSPSLNLKNTGTDTDQQYAGIFFEVGSGGSNGQASIDCVHDGTGFEADLAFATRQSSGNVNERMRILSSGGITFNGDTATANALDDYEEGTFTPAITCQNGTASLDGSWNTMSYTKIGRTVHIGGGFRVGSRSSPSGSLYITGLPFTSAAGSEAEAEQCFYVVLWNQLGSAPDYPFWGNQNKNSTQITIYSWDNTTGGAVYPSNSASYLDSSDGPHLFFNFHYYV